MEPREREKMMLTRQRRVRVLEALQQRARQFRSRRELFPFRLPREPIPLDAVVEEALPGDHRTFDTFTLRARSILQLRWDDGSRWEAWVIALPSGVDLYCDSDGDETRILASVRRDAEGGDLDRFFLELLAESAGEHFGIGTSGLAPSGVRSSIGDRNFLVDVFVDLFEVSGTEESVRRSLSAPADGDRAAASSGADFRTDVERWLEAVMRPA